MMRGSLSVEIVAKKKNPFILSSLCCCWIINEFVSKRKKNYYHDAIDLFIMFFCLDRCRISLRILQRKHEKKIDTEFFRKSCDCVFFFLETFYWRWSGWWWQEWWWSSSWSNRLSNECFFAMNIIPHTHTRAFHC